MVLISVDFPQPFGPRMATCSPALIGRLKSSSATLSPRMTRTFFKSTRAGSMASPKLSMISKTLLYHTSFAVKQRRHLACPDARGAAGLHQVEADCKIAGGTPTLLNIDCRMI